MVVFSGSYVLISYQTGFLNKVLTGVIPSIEFRANFTVMLLMAYLPMAQYFLIKWSREHRQSLAKLTHSLPAFSFRLSRFWGVVGMLMQFWFFFSESWFNGDVFDLNFWSFRLVISHIFVLSMGWHLYRLLASLIQYANQFSTIAKSLTLPDLFDEKLPKIFVQHGVRNALLLVVFVSICGNLIVAPGNRLDAALLIAIISSLCAVLVLILPVLGIHRVINRTKQKHLTNIQGQILLLTEDLSSAKIDWLKLSTLLALETRTQAVREWPFDVSSISRFIFYIIIGLSSWVGAALVEKLLDSFF
ncbi:MAG: hypothetical protein JKY19_03505 [Alcanivoracaceae bacterium]|nr:hypothetical protein [Alcanivoracaceae bacterium]